MKRHSPGSACAWTLRVLEEARVGLAGAGVVRRDEVMEAAKQIGVVGTVAPVVSINGVGGEHDAVTRQE